MYEDSDEYEWSAEWEHHPMYRMWAGLPMDYTEYRERQADDPGWKLPDVWP